VQPSEPPTDPSRHQGDPERLQQGHPVAADVQAGVLRHATGRDDQAGAAGGAAPQCRRVRLYFKVCTLCAPLSDRAVELLLKQKHMAMPGVQAAIDEKDYEGADYMIRKLEKNWVSIALDNLR
jgi:hypothetical protein